MEEYKGVYKSLNELQRQAVDQIEGPVLVVAGPGTGKTQLLTTRAAHILKVSDTLPSNILCLTYTESAAHTMRERLTNMIGQAAYDVTISTYHAFGSELIRRYPVYFADTVEQRPIDELGIDEILRSVLNDLPFSNPLKSEFYLSDIKSLLSDAKRALLSPEDILRIAKSNQKICSQLNQHIEKTLKDFKKIDKHTGKLFESLLLETKNTSLQDATAEYLSLGKIWSDDLRKIIDSWHESNSTKPLTKWKDQWLAKDNSGKFIIATAAQNDRLEAFSTIYKTYEAELRKRQLYDYDDMIARAIHGLENNSDFRFTLQEQYLYIMLDEFQDTNGAQLKLVELLTDNPINEGRPNVLAVGDDDQAIYSFQGADYSHMLAFAQKYKDVAIISLKDNYRSSPPILQFSDGIVSQIQERLQHSFSGIDKTLISTSSGSEKVSVSRLQFKSDVAQYAWIAKEIKKLSLDGVAAEQIAVIAPQHKYLEPLVPYLHHAGLPVRYEKRENVLDDPIVNMLITMATLIVSLHQQNYELADSLWPEILSSDMWGLSTDLIWKLSWQANDSKQHWSGALLNEPQTRKIALFFTRLANLVNRESMETVLDYIIGISPLKMHEEDLEEFHSPFYRYYFSDAAIEQASGDFWQLLSNLTVMRQHLREYQNYDAQLLKLPDFLDFIDAHRKANIHITNTSPYYEAKDAVNLMTVYKAKGLEFMVVFVIGSIDEVWGASARRKAMMISLPPNLRYIRYAGSTLDEQLRLFYVAITRAKNMLYLTSYETTYTNKPLTRLRFLNETENEDSTVMSPLLPQNANIVLQPDQTAPELVTLTLYWQQRHHEGINIADLKALLEPRLLRYQLSPSNINQFTDILVGGPKNFLINSLLRFPHAIRPNAQYGTAMHETLEWIHLYNKEHGKLPRELDVLNYFENRITNKRLLKNQIRQFSDRGKASLDSYLKQRSHTIDSKNETEFNFRREGVFVGEAHLSGNIDKIIVNKDDKTVAIVDYKTGQSYSKWGSNIVLHQYRQQLYTYKLLIEHSHTFRGYTVSDAYLEFVEPDAGGKINELHLRFDDIELEEFKQLIKGIWSHVIGFNFPDTSAYPQTLKGITMFEADIRKLAQNKIKIAPQN